MLGIVKNNSIQTCYLVPVAHRCTRFENPGEGPGGLCQILVGWVYRGCENFGGREHFFGVLLHFY